MIDKEVIPYYILLSILVIFAAYNGWAMKVRHNTTPAFYYHQFLV
jgi:hypothetical protein